MWSISGRCLLGIYIPSRQGCAVTLLVFVRGRQVLSISRGSPLRVLRAVHEMSFLAVERLDGAGPIAAVHANDRLALMLRFDGLELRVRVVVWRTRHAGGGGREVACEGAGVVCDKEGVFWGDIRGNERGRIR